METSLKSKAFLSNNPQVFKQSFYRDRANLYYPTAISIDNKDVWLFYELVHDYSVRGRLDKHLEDQRNCAANCSYVDIEGETARVGWQYLDDDKFYELIIDRVYLLELVNKWYDLSERNAKEIIVSYDGKKFEIEGVFEGEKS
jgi:hypothetical protein